MNEKKTGAWILHYINVIYKYNTSMHSLLQMTPEEAKNASTKPVISEPTLQNALELAKCAATMADIGEKMKKRAIIDIKAKAKDGIVDTSVNDVVLVKIRAMY